ncbi:GTPase IMAP family member 7-like [Pomacea canaliculata]|nr:GTPase IMAP family member 7-like [Pomacea canaliculata]
MFANESSALKAAEPSECHDSGHQDTAKCLTKHTTVAAHDEGETFRLLLVGKTGAGKSTTGNTILGEDFFDSEASFDSVTDLCQLKRSQRSGENIEILDSPGLFDTRKGHEAVATAIAKSVAGMNPGPHAILYVIKIGRYTEEEEGVYNRLLELFDKDLASYTIVVFTGGDSIKSGRNMDDMLANAPESLKRIFRACQNRYVVFNNMVSDKQPQVDLLLQKVRELVAANGGKPYTCPKYFHIGEAMEEEVRKKMAKVEKQHLQSKQYVQELEAKAKQAEEAVVREKEEFEKKEQARQKEMRELEAKRTAQLESLKQQLEQQQMSEERRRQETEAFLKKLEEDRRQQMREMEEERKLEQENLNRKEEEMNTMIESRMKRRGNFEKKWRELTTRR